MDLETSFGRWLRHRRRALDLTQDDLARRVGCAIVSIQKLEADERRPSCLLAERLADGLQVAAEDRAAIITLARAEPYHDRGPAAAEAAERVLRAPERSPTSLPAPLTRLIGRKQDIAAVRNALLRGEVRLLTLLGPPGIGKTSLSIAVAREVQPAFSDGVSFVALAPLGDPALVIATIALALGIKESAGQALFETLKAVLQAQRRLLLLDNFEHLLEAAPLIVELLEACVGLKALITSRAALHVRGERLYAVPPLLLPDLTQRPTTAVLARTPAVALLVERAQAVLPHFTLTAQNAAAVAAICVRLDGLPLALELAAARVTLLSPEALLARLEQRLAVLTDGARDLPPRHRTLRAAIAWSYELLGAGEQRLFRRLGVFVGGCTLQAAEAVCNASSDLPLDVLDGLATLVDTSLLRREEGGDGEPRFVMLETIREYAVERLEVSGEAETLQQQHAAYLVSLAERAGAGFAGAEQVAWIARMEREDANLRAALQWTAERGVVEIGLRMAVSWWWERGAEYVTEGRMWIEKLLRQSNNLSIALRAKALMITGDLASMQGDYRAAHALLGESLALSRAIGDAQRIAATLMILGYTAMAQADYQQALELLEESRVLFQELGDRVGLALALLRLGVVLSFQADYARAMTLCEESLTIAQECDNCLLMAWAFKHLGNLAQRQGDASQARKLLAKSLALFQEARSMVGFTAYLEGMAEVAGLDGQPERLVRLFGAAMSLHSKLGMLPYPVEQVAYERLLLAARAQLGEDAFAAARAAGRAMTVEQAIAEGLATGAATTGR